MILQKFKVDDLTVPTVYLPNILANIFNVCNGIVLGTRDAFPCISPALGALVWLLTHQHCCVALESTEPSPTVNVIRVLI